MSGSSEELIEAATRKLPDDPEMKIAAGRELRHLLDHEGPQNDGPTSELGRWKQVDAKHRPAIWKAALAALIVLVASLTFAVLQKEIVFHVGQWFPSDNTWEETRERSLETVRESEWTPEQKLLLLGDVSSDSPSERKKALWASSPTDASYYMEYTKAFLGEHDSLPPDYLATVARIDPDNAAFIYLAAGVNAKGVVEKLRQSSADRKTGKPSEWRILDEAKMEDALAFAEAAGSRRQFDFREGQLTAKRARLLPQGSLIDSNNTTGFLFSDSFVVFQTYPLGNLFQAKARWCVLNAKQDEFIRLLASMERFYQLQTLGEHSLLVDLLVMENTARPTYDCFEKSAVSLGLPKEAERLRIISERLQRRLDHRKSASPPRTTKMERETSASHHFLTAPIDISDDLLLPGIRRDHALTARVFVLCLSGLLGIVALLLFLARFISPQLVRKLSTRFDQLFTVRDHLCILALGMMLPVAYTLVISRFTVFGIGHWGLDNTLPALPIAHLIATFLLAIGVSIMTARWRLAKRAPAFGLAKSVRWFEWLIVLIATIYIPVIGWRIQAYQPEPKEMGRWSLLLLPLAVWIIIVAARIPLGQFRDRIAKAAVARELIPVCGCAMLGLFLLCHLLRIEENRNHQQYTWDQFAPESVGTHVGEATLAKKLHKEIQTALGLQP